MKYPKGIKAVYDDGKSWDRYAVYFSDRKGRRMDTFGSKWPYVGMSEFPFHPQGFGQHGTGMLGRHNGKRIAFEALPLDCQKLALRDVL